MNPLLTLPVVLLVVIWKICLTLDIWLAYTAAHLSGQAFGYLNQVEKMSYLGNSSSKTRKYYFAVSKLSNFLINNIFAIAGADLVMSTISI